MRQKIKVIEKGISISDEEIDQYKSFDRILADVNGVTTPSMSQIKAMLGIAVMVGVLIYSAVLYFDSSVNIVPTHSHSDDIMSNSTQPVLEPSGPEIPDSDFEKEWSVLLAGIDFNPTQKENENLALTKKSTKPQALKKAEKKEVPSETFIDATPLDGMENLYAYLNDNLIYPTARMKDSIEGIVMVQFFILPDSTVGNVSIKSSLGEGFDEEAIRLVQNMPLWVPASKNGKVIERKFSIPIGFSVGQALTD